MPLDAKTLDEMFRYHPFTNDQILRSATIRACARAMADAIVDNTPASADQTCAVRHVLDAMMTANHAIATEGEK